MRSISLARLCAGFMIISSVACGGSGGPDNQAGETSGGAGSAPTGGDATTSGGGNTTSHGSGGSTVGSGGAGTGGAGTGGAETGGGGTGGAGMGGSGTGGSGTGGSGGGSVEPSPSDGDIYVAPDGLESNPGTLEAPTTLYKAVTMVKPGQTIFMRGGVYLYLPTVKIEFGNDGTANDPKRLFGYPGEKVVIDFKDQYYKKGDPASPRGVELIGNYWHFKRIEIANAGDNGLFIAGHHNTIEHCVFHNNRDSGLQLGGRLGEKLTPVEEWPSYNKVINCDSYSNFDPPDGGDADGFAPKLNVGEGNEFHGCRAWNNSDDGWDLFNRNGKPLKPVLMDQCWAFDNGYQSGGYMSQPPPVPYMGNGNGFKMGGDSGLASDHIITRSVAFGNKVRGFDENNNVGNITVKNCTGWLNGTMNFAFGEGGFHTFINNISHKRKSSDEPVGTQTTNAFEGATDADFVSFDRSLAKAPRNPDGSLPATDFLRLAPGSQFIDAGSTDGPMFPFSGKAPDLGAFEVE
ncbi:right-handed parallel beta-helix repeat-containing protein [Polyangium aurulentum]|uniref:right-handed parallel beta-helix repeat-containing protein n=1 Tax=Polyangium aurulentum TaxID=2567896 RepID=UPI0010ADA6DE|nr:right-handed parallel beta-helix repeat-containing protein [Polyangium aurulentum]UQA59859.1 right-handed parallel beta-helix repeat-containing protein [Polyangium aurulentum]